MTNKAKTPDSIRQVMEEIDPISDSLCLAKWHHSTIYLQTGETHSCYHPPPHKIPLEELENNPGALHNTKHKKQERLQMLSGEKPSDCSYCWNIECMGKEYISDRHIKTASIYSPERLQEIMDEQWDFDISPSYIEISFGNECNFKCGYCHPKASSRYYQEIKTHGPVETVKNHRCDIDWLTIYEEEENPYVEAWWQWYPEIRSSLQILRVTGGEPLMHKSTWKLLKDIEMNPLPNLELNINSNLGMKHSRVQMLASKVNDLVSQNKVKKFRLFTSIDTWDKRAEYMRFGLDMDLFEKNLDHYLIETRCPVSLMITFNILCVSTFKSLLEKILEWRKKYNTIWKSEFDQMQMIDFDLPYLKEPLQYDINILPKEEYMKFMYECKEFMEENRSTPEDKNGFSELEYERMNRLVEYMETTVYSDEKIAEGRKDFYNFFTELDNRRGTNFEENFPEMMDFMNKCKNGE